MTSPQWTITCDCEPNTHFSPDILLSECCLFVSSQQQERKLRQTQQLHCDKHTKDWGDRMIAQNLRNRAPVPQPHLLQAFPQCGQLVAGTPELLCFLFGDGCVSSLWTGVAVEERSGQEWLPICVPLDIRESDIIAPDIVSACLLHTVTRYLPRHTLARCVLTTDLLLAA